MKNWRKLPNGQYFNEERQTFFDYNPILENHKTIMTSEGILNYYDYADFIKLPEGSRGVIPAFCIGIEKRKNTTYANFFDFEHISNGKRPVRGQWIDFVENFKPETCYLLMVNRNNLYPAGIKIIKKSAIIKK